LFSPTGTGAGDAQLASTFDPSPGNALGAGAVTAVLAGPGSTFQLYYQAAMGTVNNHNGNPITSGTYAGLNTTYQITVVASITEVVTSVSLATNTATFAVAPIQSANSYVKMFENPAVVNNALLGTGYTAGTMIYQGSPVATVNGAGNFSNVPNVTQPFDQHTPGAYPGIMSVVGNGSSTVDFMTTSTNPSYFITPPPTVLALEFTTTNTVPFMAIDPSMVFKGLGPGSTDITPHVGAINGQSGPDFQFVADAFVTPIPEPSSLALLGLGLGVVFALGRRGRAAGA
jgi:hypothetical protein